MVKPYDHLSLSRSVHLLREIKVITVLSPSNLLEPDLCTKTRITVRRGDHVISGSGRGRRATLWILPACTVGTVVTSVFHWGVLR